jgi:hypothetical protein
MASVAALARHEKPVGSPGELESLRFVERELASCGPPSLVSVARWRPRILPKKRPPCRRRHWRVASARGLIDGQTAGEGRSEVP